MLHEIFRSYDETGSVLVSVAYFGSHLLMWPLTCMQKSKQCESDVFVEILQNKYISSGNILFCRLIQVLLRNEIEQHLWIDLETAIPKIKGIVLACSLHMQNICSVELKMQLKFLQHSCNNVYTKVIPRYFHWNNSHSVYLELQS